MPKRPQLLTQRNEARELLYSSDQALGSTTLKARYHRVQQGTVSGAVEMWQSAFQFFRQLVCPDDIAYRARRRTRQDAPVNGKRWRSA